MSFSREFALKVVLSLPTPRCTPVGTPCPHFGDFFSLKTGKCGGRGGKLSGGLRLKLKILLKIAIAPFIKLEVYKSVDASIFTLLA